MSLASLKQLPKTGIDSLDRQHDELVRELEALCDSFDNYLDESIVARRFGAAYALTAEHFELEEGFLRKSRHADYRAHKADHERLLRQMRRMIAAYENGDCEDCGANLGACLEALFYDHGRNADAALCTLAN